MTQADHRSSHGSLTKVLATLGPASDDPRMIAKLVEHGASLFRLNFSHGSTDDHARRLGAVRRVSAETGVPLAVVGDLPGPKIRVGRVGSSAGAAMVLETGQDALVRGDLSECVPGDLPVIACNYAKIAHEVDPGNRVLINDGAVRMLAVVSDGEQLLCRVTHGGPVTTGKGINLPDSDLSIPATTERDERLAAWAVEHGVDYLALSFVRRGEEIRRMQELLRAACRLPAAQGAPGDAPPRRVPLIAKIETPQAVRNLDDILSEADAVMVARGDLGVELELARVPVIQKRIVRRAHDFGRPVIVATQMLESMIEHPTPTRAEVSDVANAIMDGADAVMLSGETAVGKYPFLAVEMMRRVAQATEESMRESVDEPRPVSRLRNGREVLPALAHGAWHMARDVGAVLAVVWTPDGEAARYLSRNNFFMPILGFTNDTDAWRRMALYFGVTPVLLDETPVHRSDFARIVDRYVMDRGCARPGDPIVLLGGKPFNDPGATNTAAVRFVGDLIRPS